MSYETFWNFIDECIGIWNESESARISYTTFIQDIITYTINAEGDLIKY